MEINVSCENNSDKNFIFSLNEIQIFAVQMLKFGLNSLENSIFPQQVNFTFDITLCDNGFIHEINRTYRNIDKPTDVITFSLFYDSEEKIVVDNTVNLGQILISIDKVESQAIENNVSKEYEFLNLLAHGILHLIGYDHQTEELLVNMLDLQEQMIKDISNVKI